jgi:gentisate 1,2-dioxygenase
MTSLTHTELENLPMKIYGDETQELMSSLEQTHTKPLWAQMTRLNPPVPNPQAIPHIWKYDQIRPHLVKAGELITEKQAERRVLMLVNPARGSSYPFQTSCNAVLISSLRCTLHDRHSICRLTTCHA